MVFQIEVLTLKAETLMKNFCSEFLLFILSLDRHYSNSKEKPISGGFIFRVIVNKFFFKSINSNSKEKPISGDFSLEL